MSPSLNFEITRGGPTAEDVQRRGFIYFDALAEHVRRLPYGRPSDGHDVLAVLKEGRGTCSFKHRLLAAVAHERGHSEVELVVGIYAMSEENTPGVGAVLKSAGHASIPEAHCYLRVANHRCDFTGLDSGSSSPFAALISEHVVLPESLPAEKHVLHQQVVRHWANSQCLSFERAWSLREACIQALAAK